MKNQDIALKIISLHRRYGVPLVDVTQKYNEAKDRNIARHVYRTGKAVGFYESNISHHTYDAIERYIRMQDNGSLQKVMSYAQKNR